MKTMIHTKITFKMVVSCGPWAKDATFKEIQKEAKREAEQTATIVAEEASRNGRRLRPLPIAPHDISIHFEETENE